jgi:hypothetical protein
MDLLPAHLQKGSVAVQSIVTFIKRLTRMCLQVLHHHFVDWTKPTNTSLLVGTVSDLARSKSELVAENALLRKPLIILRRQVKRPAFTKTDRMLLVLLARMVRAWKQALFIVQPETLLRWHRQGFKLYWRYTSRAASAKPKISAETVALIKEMATRNRLWGAERIRGELLKLGLRVCKRTIQKYMRHVRSTRPRGQNWSTFLRTHAEQIWACDAPPSHRPHLSGAFCLLSHRPALAHSHPCGRDAVSQRCMGRAYRCAKLPPTAWGRSTSSVITMASLVEASLELHTRVASRFSLHLTTPHERMPSVSGLWGVCDVNVSITCSFSRRSSWIGSFMPLPSISIELGLCWLLRTSVWEIGLLCPMKEASCQSM